jgi:anti-sigma-K factor RskA
MIMKHEQIIDHLEEFVLGTLPDEEYRAIEAHLDSGCAECLERFRELSEILARIADSVPQADPPTELRARIMESLSGSDATPVSSPDSETGTAIHRSWGLRLAVIVSTAASISLAVWAWQLNSQMGEIQKQLVDRELQVNRLETEIESYMDATSLLAEPGMQFIDLAGVAPNEQAFGKVVVDPEGSHAVVYMYELPPTPEGMTYQLWMVRDGIPTSAGMFTVNEDGSAKLMLEPMPGIGQFASFDVTIEPAGGMPEPTGMMYLSSPGVLQSPDIE